MPKGLRRWHGEGDLHYITCSRCAAPYGARHLN